MNDTLRNLLGLKHLAPGQEGVEIGFALPIPMWGWALIAGGAIALAFWSYRHLEGPRWARLALAGLRSGLLVLLAVLLAGPKLIRNNETVEKDWVVAMVDRSSSMKIKDAAAAGGERGTREEQLNTALAAARPAFERLDKERVLVWQGFDAASFDLKPAMAAEKGPAPVRLGPSEGRRTLIGASMEQALAKTAARPLSGVVLFTDGRSTDAPDRAMMKRLIAEKVPVLAVALGSADPAADLSVRKVEGPNIAFVNDVVPVQVEVERVGGGNGAGGGAKVQLIDARTGEVLDERAVKFDAPAVIPGAANPPSGGAPAVNTQRLTLTSKPGDAGAREWTVRIIPDAGAAADLVAENNQASLTIDLTDRPLRVVYFDGYPRWEYRYLKNVLVREKSFTATAMLLSSGRRYVPEGSEEVASVPNSEEEWAKYDVVVMGDVRPEIFTEEQLKQLRSRVSNHGTGLLWIGGEGATPTAWRGSPLADLLPISLDVAGESIRSFGSSVVMKPTPLAERLGVLRLADVGKDASTSTWPAAISDPTTVWSQLRWAQRLRGASLKPAVEVLATAEAVNAGLVGAHRGYGRGRGVDAVRGGADHLCGDRRDLALAVRAGRGVARAVLDAARAAAGARLGRPRGEAGHSRGLAAAERGRAAGAGQRRDRGPGVDRESAGFVASADRSGGCYESHSPHSSLVSGPDAIELVLRPQGETTAASGGTGRRTFTGTWIPDQAGAYRVEVTDPLLSGKGIAADAEVWLPDDELRRPETDHELLRRLCEETGGKMLTAADLPLLDNLLPHREVRIVGRPDEESLWDTPLALIALLTLATLEWAGRRLIRLV